MCRELVVVKSHADRMHMISCIYWAREILQLEKYSSSSSSLAYASDSIQSLFSCLYAYGFRLKYWQIRLNQYSSASTSIRICAQKNPSIWEKVILQLFLTRHFKLTRKLGGPAKKSLQEELSEGWADLRSLVLEICFLFVKWFPWPDPLEVAISYDKLKITPRREEETF